MFSSCGILLDLLMPRMDGEEFLRRLRGSVHRQTKVVVLSGHRSAVQKAQELQADGCLVKPVDLEVLLKTLKPFVPG